MNRAIQAHGAAGDAGASGIEAAGRLDELRGPVTVAWGGRGPPGDPRGGPRRSPRRSDPRRARSHVLAGVAHLPGLEAPEAVADLVAERRARGPAPAGTP